MLQTQVGRAGAALSLGYGNFLTGNCYIGGEINLDITGSRRTEVKNDIDIDDYGTTKLKTRGFVPTVALRLGGYVPSFDCIFYARVGFTFLNNHFENTIFPNQDFGNQKITSIVGIGFEKTIADNCSMRIEGDYRFPADKKKENLMMYNYVGNPVNSDYRAIIRNKVRSYVVRVVCVYHF